MVWFTFAFLLGIPKDNEEKLEESSKQRWENSETESNYVETEVSKPNFLCHIEYVLIPNEAPKFIDVVCWNRAAKIYFENSTSAIIPFEVEKLRWIHFRVHHNATLELEEIPLFQSHNVKFNIVLGNKNFGEPAKFDKPKKFYGPKFSSARTDNSIEKQMFQPLSESLDDLITVSYLKEHLTPRQQLYIPLDTTVETSENYSKLHKAIVDLSNEYHDENCEKTPTPPFEDIPPLLNVLQPRIEEPVTSKKGKEIKTDKKITVKTKEPEKIEFSITGEQFLSGKKVFENCIKYNLEELPYVLCLGTIKNALSRAQAAVYSPLSVVISSLKYLPVDDLKNTGVTKLKFRFAICNTFLAESNLIPIEKRMKINFARTLFTHTLDKQDLIHFIQTGGLNIDILGSREKSQLGPRGTQGEINRTDEFITLGRVSADISPILLQPHRVHLKCNLQMSKDYDFSWETENNHFISTNEFNSCFKKSRADENLNYSRPSNNSSPVLTLTAGLGYPLTDARLSVTTNPDLFNRLFAVFSNMDSAIPIIQIIQNEVDEYLGLVDYTKGGKNLKRPLTNNNTESLLNAKDKNKTRMTGFLIDCVDKILIYAESSVFGGVQKVWASTSSLSPLQGHILYDSSLIFLDRLYERLFQFGGFIGITLKEPPHLILSKSQSYRNQTIPKPAQKALRSLSLLTNCKSIKAAIKNKLFPDFDSLASLAIEFGVPIQFSDNT